MTTEFAADPGGTSRVGTCASDCHHDAVDGAIGAAIRLLYAHARSPDDVDKVNALRAQAEVAQLGDVQIVSRLRVFHNKVIRDTNRTSGW